MCVAGCMTCGNTPAVCWPVLACPPAGGAARAGQHHPRLWLHPAVHCQQLPGLLQARSGEVSAGFSGCCCGCRAGLGLTCGACARVVWHTAAIFLHPVRLPPSDSRPLVCVVPVARLLPPAVSLLQGKRLDIVRSEVVMSDLVGDVHCIIEAMIGRAGSVTLHPPQLHNVPDVVCCDPDRLRGVLLNLYTNAGEGAVGPQGGDVWRTLLPACCLAHAQSQRSPHMCVCQHVGRSVLCWSGWKLGSSGLTAAACVCCHVRVWCCCCCCRPAAKFTKRGHIVLRVRCVTREWTPPAPPGYHAIMLQPSYLPSSSADRWVLCWAGRLGAAGYRVPCLCFSPAPSLHFACLGYVCGPCASVVRA